MIATENPLLVTCLSETKLLEQAILACVQEEESTPVVASSVPIKSLLADIHAITQEHFIALGDLITTEFHDEIAERDATTLSLVHNAFEPSITPPSLTGLSFLQTHHTRLCQLSMAYTVLHTLGLAFRHPTVATLALKHLRDSAFLVTKISRNISGVIIAELGENEIIDKTAATRAAINVIEVWHGH